MVADSTAGEPVLELSSADIPSPGDPNVVVLRAVDWQVRTGECWLVAGTAGTGKSSLLAVAAGLIRPGRGVQRLFGAELRSLSEPDQVALRRKVGVVFGGGGRLFAQLTVLENVLLPLVYHRGPLSAEAEVWVETLLGELTLKDVLRRRPGELPRRLAQRVALARALALRPEILLLDDPAAVLGPREERWWAHLAVDGLGGWRPSALVVACSDPRPWQDVSNRYALVRQGAWSILTRQEELEVVLRPAEGE